MYPRNNTHPPLFFAARTLGQNSEAGDGHQTNHQRACAATVETQQNQLLTSKEIENMVKKLKTHRCVFDMDTRFCITQAHVFDDEMS